MSSSATANVVRTGAGTRFVIYSLLALFCLYYLLPLYVMIVNSLKPLSEIQAGGMMSLPDQWTIAPWASAWSTAQIGVDATGLRPHFLNSILMVVPAVAISTVLGALNGYVLTKWRFRGGKWSKYLLRRLVRETVGAEIAYRSKYGFAQPLWKIPGMAEKLGMREAIMDSEMFDSAPFAQGARELLADPEQKRLGWMAYCLAQTGRRLAEISQRSRSSSLPSCKRTSNVG